MSRSMSVLTLKETLTNIPVDWEEMGGGAAVRYSVRRCEVSNLLYDMAERIESVECDARYFLEDREDIIWWDKKIDELRKLSLHLAGEAEEIRKAMPY